MRSRAVAPLRHMLDNSATAPRSSAVGMRSICECSSIADASEPFGLDDVVAVTTNVDVDVDVDVASCCGGGGNGRHPSSATRYSTAFDSSSTPWTRCSVAEVPSLAAPGAGSNRHRASSAARAATSGGSYAAAAVPPPACCIAGLRAAAIEALDSCWTAAQAAASVSSSTGASGCATWNTGRRRRCAIDGWFNGRDAAPGPPRPRPRAPPRARGAPAPAAPPRCACIRRCCPRCCTTALRNFGGDTIGDAAAAASTSSALAPRPPRPLLLLLC